MHKDCAGMIAETLSIHHGDAFASRRPSQYRRKVKRK
jgi:hypothetical protein